MADEKSREARPSDHGSDGEQIESWAGEPSQAPPPVSGGQENADLAACSAPGPRRPDEDLRDRQDQLLDEAVEETFPASDPISPKRITK